MDMDVATQQFTTNTDLQPLKQEVENEDGCHGQGQTFCISFIILVLEWQCSSLHFADRSFSPPFLLPRQDLTSVPRSGPGI